MHFSIFRLQNSVPIKAVDALKTNDHDISESYWFQMMVRLRGWVSMIKIDKIEKIDKIDKIESLRLTRLCWIFTGLSRIS